MSIHATRLVIITEKLLFKHLTRIIDTAGAPGYTVMAAEGKGSRNTRTSDHPSLSGAMENIKVEIITADESIARAIADEFAGKYFANFSGIAYLDSVEVLHSHKI